MMGIDFGNVFGGGGASRFLTGIPLVGRVFDDSPEKGMDELAKNQDLYANIKTPDLTWTDYKPENFTPEMMQAQTVQEDPTLLGDQMSALQKLSGLADTGLSDVDQAAYAKARSDAGQISHAGLGAALQDAQNRGASGSGLEFAMREMANQNAANQDQNALLQQAADAAKQRALYAQAYGQQLGQVRGQNYQTAANNTNILNQFNQANTQARNAANYGNIQQQNQAQMYNQQGKNNVAQQNFNNAITKAGGQAQANTGMAQGYAAQNAANTSAQNQWIQAGSTVGAAALGGKKP